MRGHEVHYFSLQKFEAIVNAVIRPDLAYVQRGNGRMYGIYPERMNGGAGLDFELKTGMRLVVATREREGRRIFGERIRAAYPLAGNEILVSVRRVIHQTAMTWSDGFLKNPGKVYRVELNKVIGPDGKPAKVDAGAMLIGVPSADDPFILESARPA